uniref:Transposase (Putative), gypsy type n=1 Tax=Tanacetum cinerariifolium TaxID=118510 RepID=A0A6L2KTK2_TANCI|nr:transposase (putative), gypsy type [Tanacetum cinerariifolium]
MSATQHACMVSELHLRYEHEITIRENFEKKFIRGSEIIQQRDSEVFALKSKLERLEGEAVDVVTLRKHVSKLDTAATAKSDELTSLNVQNVELLSLHGKVAGEAKMRVEFMFEGLEAGIEHGKANRSLAEVEAYDSEIEAKYVVVVHELENVSFSLLDQLEILKYSPFELLMSSLMLEGDHGEDDPTPEFCKLQPVCSQVTVLVYYECGGSRDPGSISYEVLLSDALTGSRAHGEKQKKVSLETCCPSVAMPYVSSQETSLVVTDYQISSVAIVSDGPATVKPHDDLFDTTMQDKPSNY